MLPSDVHLMIENPGQYTGAFAAAGGTGLVAAFAVYNQENRKKAIETLKKLTILS